MSSTKLVFASAAALCAAGTTTAPVGLASVAGLKLRAEHIHVPKTAASLGLLDKPIKEMTVAELRSKIRELESKVEAAQNARSALLDQIDEKFRRSLALLKEELNADLINHTTQLHEEYAKVVRAKGNCRISAVLKACKRRLRELIKKGKAEAAAKN